MNFPFAAVFIATWIYTKCAAESDLRIEYNQTLDNQTNLDKLYIAFVNKANSNETNINKVAPDGTLHVYINPEHLKAIHDNVRLSRTSRDADGKYLRYATVQMNRDKIRDVNANGKKTIALFKQLGSKDVKRKLDLFTMSKRSSFYITPAFKVPKYKSHFDEGNYYNNHVNIVLDKDLYELQKQNGLSRNRNSDDNIIHYIRSHMSHDVQAIGNEDLAENSYNNNILKNEKRKTKDDIFNQNGQPQSKDFLNMLTHPEFEEILRKQNDLIAKLENHLQNDKHKYLRTEFDDILYTVEKNKNKNKTLPSQERITEITKPPTPSPMTFSNVGMLIDETKVRETLKKDPLVQRILKMAKQKKAEYMKNARKYYNNLLYS